ncbi:MAG: YCF48-related protein [Phycisphaerales bacterium]|nr:YCF48-related protein [Phycisphaerales bacterium]
MKKIWLFLSSSLFLFSFTILSCTKEIEMPNSNAIANGRTSTTNTLHDGTNVNGVMEIVDNSGNGGFLYTNNGGQTWAPVQMNHGNMIVSSVVFSSDTNGVAVGNYPSGTATNNIYSYTSDGGRTWSNPQSISGMGTINAIAFSSPANGVAVGNNGLYCLTNDGGHNWSAPKLLGGNDAMNISSIAFSSATNGVVVGSNNYFCAYSYTNDGGNNWFSWMEIPLVPAHNNISSVAFNSTLNGTLLGGATGTYFSTNNSGDTWYPTATSGDALKAIYSVVFNSATTGVVISSNKVKSSDLTYGLYRYTDDGGQSWSDPYGINGMSNIYSVAFSSATNGVVVGSNGNNAVYSYTSNRGQSWTNVQPCAPNFQIALSVAFAKPLFWWY